MNIIAKLSNCAERQKDLLLATGLALIFAVLTLYWFALDHRLPSQDEAGHILNCYAMADVLAHCHVWRAHWWYEVFTVNCYYPPTYYIVCGMLKLILGPSRLVDILCVALFNMLLSVTVFGIARYLNTDRLTAALSVIVINFFPLVSILAHSFLLDLPLLSMISLGICSLLWWRDKPSWTRSIITGFVLAAACMTKQLVAPYIVGTGIYLVADSFGIFGREKNLKQVMQLFLMALIVLIICLPWVLVNYSFIHSGFAAVQGTVIAKGKVFSVWSTLGTYLSDLPDDLSILLGLCAILGIATCSKQKHTQLLPLTCATVLGVILLLCNQKLLAVNDRYIVPITISLAIYAALGTVWLNRSRFRVMSMLSIALMSAACLQFISFNFTPYPISKPKFIAEFSKIMRVQFANENKNNPRQATLDWGQGFVLDEIYKVDGRAPSWLNVMANHPDMNAHSFQLLAMIKGSLVKPTTSRVNTIFGDKVSFDPKTALYFDWYLFKDGDSGYQYFDKASSNAADDIRKFVESSGHFKFIAKRSLPDGTDLYLYKKISG